MGNKKETTVIEEKLTVEKAFGIKKSEFKRIQSAFIEIFKKNREYIKTTELFYEYLCEDEEAKEVKTKIFLYMLAISKYRELMLAGGIDNIGMIISQIGHALGAAPRQQETSPQK